MTLRPVTISDKLPFTEQASDESAIASLISSHCNLKGTECSHDKFIYNKGKKFLPFAGSFKQLEIRKNRDFFIAPKGKIFHIIQCIYFFYFYFYCTLHFKSVS